MANSVPVNSCGNRTSHSPEWLQNWIQGTYCFAMDHNDFHRNLIVNLGLFAVGIWVARNLMDNDLMAPQPVA
ncbi:mitochondrial import receptor subunit TOM6 homolog [Sceloporus undulatus]|uniref:mitochondrial import receptor subunit TOM6 homolog n=1 Tax=Sceloporus undulatus TaxID=8520 RepID=UPI001C4D300F|nr:mitochondrial import receptor subunit TOM6 homolog [Sceloporus undulatus]